MIENKENLKELYGDYMTLPLIPLRGLTVFPNVVINFDIGRDKSIKALEKAMVMEQRVFFGVAEKRRHRAAYSRGFLSHRNRGKSETNVETSGQCNKNTGGR